jgi:hypothetical protein
MQISLFTTSCGYLFGRSWLVPALVTIHQKLINVPWITLGRSGRLRAILVMDIQVFICDRRLYSNAFTQQKTD